MSTRALRAVTRCTPRSAAGRFTELLVLLVVAGCTVPPAPPVVVAAPPAPVAAAGEPAAPPPAVIDWDRLDTLLILGDQALKDDRLLTPIDDCAYDYYQAALKVAPDHPAPRHGLDRLVDRYVALASEAAQRGQRDRALNLLERAKYVHADSPAIAMAEAQLELFGDAKRTRVILDAAALSARAASVADELTRLGAKAKADGTWVEIVARNDAEGRWIYQQLRRAPGERRIRAELTLGAPPRIEIVDLDTDTR
jgi:hypothetical protein